MIKVEARQRQSIDHAVDVFESPTIRGFGFNFLMATPCAVCVQTCDSLRERSVAGAWATAMLKEARGRAARTAPCA